MTWEPTHVQFTVLRARNLVGKIKGKTSAKITDVFVTISLGKEKFQTSTLKYGGKVKNSVEWFEECDLGIPDMGSDVEISVLNRGLLSDEFIGYVSLPLHDYDVYDRPTSRWVQLGQKPSKLPDGRCRGELEVRLTFHVKSRTDDASPGSMKGKRAGSIKSLVTAVGDKFKFTRTRSLRGDGNQLFSTPQPSKPFKEEGTFARSYSLTNEQRRNRDFKSRSLMNLPGEQSMTLPTRGRNKLRPSLDDSALGVSNIGSRSSRGSVTSQEGYLESMFRKECEVDDRMNDLYDEEIEEESEGEYDGPRRSARTYNEHATTSESGSSESESEEESDEDIELPKVRLKNGNIDDVNNAHLDDEGFEYIDGESEGHSKSEGEGNDVKDPVVFGLVANGSNAGSSNNETESDVFNPSASPSEYTSELDRVIARENSRLKSDAMNSHGTSDGHTSTHTSSSSLSYQGVTAAERAYDRGSPETGSDSRRRISPKENFSFTSQTSNDENRNQKRRSSKLYTKGGRRYTVQGLEGLGHNRSAPDIRDLRPVLTRGESVPEDLMAVYRNMNREELVKLVVTHKAQLIRKDQYIQELEKYIDNLLVRVMETSPRILQNL
ncbi:rab11 family-interacting protein 1-like isoform X2 [Mya arenaria]|uniref:rab11 family-interacting protein 1-like isoform X2 n=1 Tax=Mya arenaria TaxID=6604 RepID=UPI0022E48652|nr:rab11 family-interacting protein 1-like isoform X2 [Mya arenaria]